MMNFVGQIKYVKIKLTIYNLFEHQNIILCRITYKLKF